jgi:hypothetical protein
MLQKVFYKSKLYLKHYSPTILTCIGAIGVVATSVMAVKVTPKAVKLLERATDEKGEDLTKLEVIQIAGPAYITTIVIGLSTISCIFGANVLNKRNQASLASAYALLDQSYRKYRKAAISVYGEDADSKIKIESAKETYVSADGYVIYDTILDQTSEKILFYDDYSQRYFLSTMSSVLNAQYHLNRNFTLRGDTNLNEFYEFLGIDKIDCGDDIGWSMDDLIESGIVWIDFENRYVKMDDGMECYIISALYGPTILYSEAY